MRVLLTGGTGFIGSYVLEQLVAANQDVRVLALPETLGQLKHSVHVVPGSVSDPGPLQRATAGMDVVLHLAGLNPGSALGALREVNVRGTQNLLNAAVSQGVRRFVLLSSVAVYGPAPYPSMWPIYENFPRRAHGWFDFKTYAQSKIEAENLVLRSHALSGIEYVILRPPVVYGPRPAIETMIKRIMAHPRLAISRDLPYPHMQWVYVSDLATGMVQAGTLQQAANEIFNIAGAELFDIQDLVNIVSDLSPRPWTGQNLRYSFEKATWMLGYFPKVNLRSGIQGVLDAIHTGTA
jgi:nucleoside-diphosphate-sugar epimerase